MGQVASAGVTWFLMQGSRTITGKVQDLVSQIGLDPAKYKFATRRLIPDSLTHRWRFEFQEPVFLFGVSER